MKPIDRESAEHYGWGDQCDGWHLLKSDGLSIIEERMPPGTAEVCHYHERAEQFFYVIDGEASMELAEGRMVLAAGQGIRVKAGMPHRISNRSDTDLRFIVVSSPMSHGDRVVVER